MMIRTWINMAACLTLTIVSSSSSSSSSASPTPNPCDHCRKYCEEMRKKTKMEDIVLCDNEGKTWKNHCDFFHRQCEALSEGKLLMVSGEGYCSTPIDSVGGIDAIGSLDSISSAKNKELETKLKATMPSIGNIQDISLKVTVGPLDSIGKLEDMDHLDDVDDVDAVPTVPNKHPPIPTPKQPRTPRPLDAKPKTINPALPTVRMG